MAQKTEPTTQLTAPEIDTRRPRLVLANLDEPFTAEPGEESSPLKTSPQSIPTSPPLPQILVDDVNSECQVQSPQEEGPVSSPLTHNVQKLPAVYRRRTASSTSRSVLSVRSSRASFGNSSRSRKGTRTRASREALTSPSQDGSNPKTYQSSPWKECVGALHRRDMVKAEGWKEDVDTLLVFAGLFSAVLTAFVVESYKMLQEDPQEKFLRAIANNTAPSAGSSTPSFEPSSTAIVVNLLWFSSLVFSLASASIGILVKQWLRNYASNTTSSPREHARIRQFRLQGLLNWRIPEIIAFLPVLLQISLAFFFIGLAALLWSLCYVVAGVVSCLIVASLLFLIITTILPTLRHDSPHRSPQALAIYLMSQAFIRLMVRIMPVTALGLDQRPWPLYVGLTQFNPRWRQFRFWLTNLIHGRNHRNWREREKADVRTLEEKLDHHVLVSADFEMMDDQFLDEVVRPCLRDVKPSVALHCLIDILTHRADGNVSGVPSWRHSAAVERSNIALLHLTADVLQGAAEAQPDTEDEKSISKILEILDKLCKATPFEVEHPDVHDVYGRIHLALAAFLSHSEPLQKASFDVLSNLWPRVNSFVTMDEFVLRALINHASCAKDKQDGGVLYTACGMVLELAIDLKHSNPAHYVGLRIELGMLLRDLEQYLDVNAYPHPSPSLLVNILNFADWDKDLVHPSLIRTLKKLVCGAQYGPFGSDVSLQADVSQRAAESLKRLYSYRRTPRRNAHMPVERLEQLGLSLNNLGGIPEVSERPSPTGDK